MKISDLTSLIAEGWTNAAIGERLGMSEYTVKNKVNRLGKKLGLEHKDKSLRVLIARWHWEHCSK